MIRSPTARWSITPHIAQMYTQRRSWGLSFSVSVIPSRHWCGATKQSPRPGSWLIRRLLAVSLALGTELLSLVGDIGAMDQRAGQLAAVAAEQDFPRWGAMGAICRGWVKVKSGDVAEGISLLRSGSAAYRATGAELWMPHYVAFLTKAYEIAGQAQEAEALLDEALRIVERTGERWFVAELNRHKGRLLLRQGHSEAAEELYRKALSIARQQEAKLWELRAAASLARLRRDQGRGAEARDILTPVYGWFTEGFDTPDLREARALLDAST